MIKLMDEILTSNNGQKSSKRLAGMMMIIIGAFSKLALIAYGAKIKLISSFTIYDKLDYSTNGLIYAGSALLGLGVAELFGKKDVK